MNDDLLILRLAVQNSLIGCVTSELRALYVKIENKIIFLTTGMKQVQRLEQR